MSPGNAWHQNDAWPTINYLKVMRNSMAAIAVSSADFIVQPDKGPIQPNPGMSARVHATATQRETSPSQN